MADYTWCSYIRYGTMPTPLIVSLFFLRHINIIRAVQANFSQLLVQNPQGLYIIMQAVNDSYSGGSLYGTSQFYYDIVISPHPPFFS